MIEALLNLKDYTPLQLAFYSACFVSWLSMYLIVVRDIVKLRFAPVPGAAWCAFFAWEILRGFVFPLGVGPLFAWGVMIFAPLSCYILWGVIRYAHKQFFADVLRRHAVAMLVAVFLAWMVVLYLFIPRKDDPSGLSSVAIVSAPMALQFIYLLRNLSEREGSAGIAKLSYASAWLMFSGNVFGALCYSLDAHRRSWLMVLWAVTVLLSLAYVVLFRRLRGWSSSVTFQAALGPSVSSPSP